MALRVIGGVHMATPSTTLGAMAVKVEE